MAPLLALLNAPAAHGAPPVIDIDGTLFLQLVVFGLLFVVLRGLVFLPYLQLRRERAEQIDGTRAQAQQLAQQSARATDEHAQGITAARQRASALRASQRLDAETRAGEQLAAARREAAELLGAARAGLATSAPAAALALRARADQLGAEIAAKVLGRPT